MNYTLLEGGDVCEEAIAWDAEQHLRFDVPFIDMKPQIYFGVLILILHVHPCSFFFMFFGRDWHNRFLVSINKYKQHFFVHKEECA